MDERMKHQPRRPTKAGLRFEVKDAEKGMVEAIFSRFNVKDLDGDITLPDAFVNGAPVLISAYNHKSWYGDAPVGRGTIRVENDCAVLEGQFWLDTEGGRETFNVVKNAGELQEWSYGFDITKTGEVTEAMRQSGVRRVIAGVKVYEVSPVLVGAGIGTETTAVKAAGEVDPPADETGSAIHRELLRFERTRATLVGR